MSKQIEEGCTVEIQGTMTPADGKVVQVWFEEAPDAEGYPIWVISENLETADGTLTDRIYEYHLKLVGNDYELCTDWEDIKSTVNWVPADLHEKV